MSADSLHIKLKINFPVIFFTVLALHLFLLAAKQFPNFAQTTLPTAKTDPFPLKIRDLKTIRTAGSPLSKIKNSAYLAKDDLPVRKISPVARGEKAPHHPLSFKDLTVAQNSPVPQPNPKIARPGTRPEVMEPKKAINAISLKGGEEIKKFMRGESSVASSAAQLSGDPRTRSLKNSDILVNLEVPEGVNPDELNKYELMFYGFQRRTAIGYVNAFYKNLDKFQRENPHLHFPMTESKQVLTGRLTYDEKGNVKQIKMIRWTNVDRLQNFFEDVLKDMDTLHNPPKPLWSQTGEFSIFFSLVING